MRKILPGLFLIGVFTAMAADRPNGPTYSVSVGEYSVNFQTKKVQCHRTHTMTALVGKAKRLNIGSMTVENKVEVWVGEDGEPFEEHPFWRQVSETQSSSVTGTETSEQKINYYIPHYNPLTLFIQPCFDRENRPTFTLFGVKEQIVLHETSDRSEATVKFKYHSFRDSDQNDDYRLTQKKIPLDKLAPAVPGVKIRTYENETDVYFIALKVAPLEMEWGSAQLVHEREKAPLQPEAAVRDNLPVQFDVKYVNALGEETVFSRISTLDRIEIDAFNQRYTEENIQGELTDEYVNLTFQAKLFPVSYIKKQLTVELVLSSDLYRYDSQFWMKKRPLTKTIHRMLTFNVQDVIEMKWPTDWSELNKTWPDLAAKIKKKMLVDLQNALAKQSLIIKPVVEH